MDSDILSRINPQQKRPQMLHGLLGNNVEIFRLFQQLDAAEQTVD
tara:strand:- start:533 stop:667 length:135 start_codon:yes stop_codon:yes gene_type:complete